MSAKPSILLFESANPRHAHEVDTFEKLKDQIPEDKVSFALHNHTIWTKTISGSCPGCYWLHNQFYWTSRTSGKASSFLCQHSWPSEVRMFPQNCVPLAHYLLSQGAGWLWLWICYIWKATYSSPWHCLGKAGGHGRGGKDSSSETEYLID